MDFPGGRTYFISRRNGRTFFKSSTRGGGFKSELKSYIAMTVKTYAKIGVKTIVR
jgi:hypothetical protein